MWCGCEEGGATDPASCWNTFRSPAAVLWPCLAHSWRKFYRAPAPQSTLVVRSHNVAVDFLVHSRMRRLRRSLTYLVVTLSPSSYGICPAACNSFIHILTSFEYFYYAYIAINSFASGDALSRHHCAGWYNSVCWWRAFASSSCRVIQLSLLVAHLWALGKLSTSPPSRVQDEIGLAREACRVVPKLQI